MTGALRCPPFCRNVFYFAAVWPSIVMGFAKFPAVCLPGGRIAGKAIRINNKRRRETTRRSWWHAMSDNNNNDERTSDLTDLTTGEYPCLVEGEAPTPRIATELNGSDLNGTTSELNGRELNGTAHDATDRKNESVKVAFWLSHLESEVTRLQAKWLSIDAEFKTREARIAELHQEIKAREAAIARLTADLEADALVAEGRR